MRKVKSLVTEETRFVPCPPNGCSKDKRRDGYHLVIHSPLSGIKICGHQVTQIIDHGPQGLLELSVHAVRFGWSVARLPLTTAKVALARVIAGSK